METSSTMKVIYTAGRFRGETPWDVHCNVHRAQQAALEVAECGVMPLCPHANTAHFDELFTAQFWTDGTLELLKRSDALYVFDEEWRESKGTVGEVRIAAAVGLPTFFHVQEMRGWLEGGSYRYIYTQDEIEELIRGR
jgi:hypothetical protein